MSKKTTWADVKKHDVAEVAGRVSILRGDARHTMLANESVDLVVTSPPYFGLRDYEDDGKPYDGQIGRERSIGAYIDALVETTIESARVLRESGSIWVNLGDRYIDGALKGIPWRFALAVVDAGLILRQEVVWEKPNGFIDAKAAGRFRRSHETWFHFVKSKSYFSNVDAVRVTGSDYNVRPQYRRARELFDAAGLTPEHEAAVRAVGIIDSTGGAVRSGGSWDSGSGRLAREVYEALGSYYRELCGQGIASLGVIPGSVMSVAAHPFKVPASLGLKGHFASFPVEWPGVLIQGWCPPGGTVLDPFGGTGTTALAATVLGRYGISIDASRDYSRIARWRVSDPAQRARAVERIGNLERVTR